MRGYYRLATEKDFERYEIPMNHFESQLPREVEILVEEGDLRKASSLLQQRNGLGIHDCHRYCKMYQTFLRAKKDFENGINVYTEY